MGDGEEVVKGIEVVDGGARVIEGEGEEVEVEAETEGEEVEGEEVEVEEVEVEDVEIEIEGVKGTEEGRREGEEV